MKAMILAAGRGERMGALTASTPKPLLRVGEYALVEHVLIGLKKAGITEIVMNVSYLADQIVKTLGKGSRYGVTIEYSYEPQALETGGGIFQALPLLGADPFLLISADIYTDFPFQLLAKKAAQLNSDHPAHLVLAPNPSFKARGDYGLNAGGCITREPPLSTYASFGALHPALFDGCKPGRFSVVPLWEKAIDQGCVSGERYEGFWVNVGDVNELEIARNSLITA